MTTTSKYAVALVAAGGGVWLVAGIAFGLELVHCFPNCGSIVLASGTTSGFPAQAIIDLTWEDFYAYLYVAAIGLLTIFIALKPFRQGQRWAWYAVLAVVLTAFLTSLIDELSWGGWYTFLLLGVLPLLGLGFSARNVFFSSEDSHEIEKKPIATMSKA